MSKSIHFFAAKSDLKPVFTAVESKRQLQYVRTGLLESSTTLIVNSGLQIPHLGIAIRGNHVHEDSYLITDANDQVIVRPVPQNKGGLLYAIDQKANPRTITLRAGGVFKTTAVIAGEVSTCTNDPDSVNLANAFTREIRRRFKRIKSFYVGPEAEQLLDAGYRLTIGVNASSEIDLVKD
jgi:hypothetical protein